MMQYANLINSQQNFPLQYLLCLYLLSTLSVIVHVIK